MWRRIGGLLALAVLTGCAGRPAEIKSTFDAGAAAYINRKGSGRIDGQAFLRRDYGRLVTAAGERVFLLPATAYTVERFAVMFGGDRRSYFGNPVPDPPEDYYQYRRETKVDMRGSFTFDNLAPGPYIVATRVFWTEPKSFFTHGGAMYDIVEVKADAVTEAVLSGK